MKRVLTMHKNENQTEDTGPNLEYDKTYLIFLEIS